MLLDSNTVIYASEPESEPLRGWLANHTLAAASVTQIEVLGFHHFAELVSERKPCFLGGQTAGLTACRVGADATVASKRSSSGMCRPRPTVFRPDSGTAMRSDRKVESVSFL